MTIGNMAALDAALIQRIGYLKTAVRNPVTDGFMTLWDATGTPGAGSLAIGNTANGRVPTDGTVGSLTGGVGFQCVSNGPLYLTGIEGTQINAAPGHVIFYDRLFHAGSYAFNAATSLSSQPSYSSRVGGVFVGTQIWIECASNYTGSQTLTVTYTDQSGNAGHTTGAVVVGLISAGMMVQLPLAAGDSGVSKIESVTSTVISAGTFNVLVIRPLAILNFVYDQAGGWLEGLARKTLTTVGMPVIPVEACIAAISMTNRALGAYNLEAQIEVASESVASPDCVWSPLFRSVAACVFVPGSNHLGFTGAAGNLGAAKGTNPRNSGKRYFEVLATAVDTGNNDPMVGIGTGDATLFAKLSSIAGYWAIQSSPQFFYHNGTPVASGVSYAALDVYQVAVDIDAGKIWFGKNNAWILSGNPSAGTNPAATDVTPGVNYYPAISMSDTCICTAHFKTADFTYTPPTGFVPW